MRQILSLSVLALLQLLPSPPSVSSLYIYNLYDYYTNSVDGGQGPDGPKAYQTVSWAVKLRYERRPTNESLMNQEAERVAKDVGLANRGQVGELAGRYVFSHETSSLTTPMDSLPEGRKSADNWRRRVEYALARHPSVAWFRQEVVRQRVKRSISFEDPMYKYQWHLKNFENSRMDINIENVWTNNVTGRGVIVAIVDDGVEWKNPDLEDNYSTEGSWDINSNDPDPSPQANSNKKVVNHHGTRCAGEIAAVKNDVCGVGVAYGARFSGIRVLDGPMTDSLEATAFNKKLQINDIYSCSWGPEDNGKTIDGPHPLAKAALRHGVSAGRWGYGNIFVVASGNGGRESDNCNYDGYANSMYTLTIGAVDEKGRKPFYAEECACMLAVTFSSGATGMRSIVTTDWKGSSGDGQGCTKRHSGTSAAAPIAAGMVALMLEVRPCLTWRDVQYIIAITSTKVDETNTQWYTNQAGFEHSHEHGFGLLDAWRLVNAALVWHTLPYLSSYYSEKFTPNQKFTASLSITQTVKRVKMNELRTLEHVQLKLYVSHRRRGDLEILLTCPSKTVSVIATARRKDESKDGLKGWTFSTVRCWGEEPFGVWNLTIVDHGSTKSGVLKSWQLKLFGSSTSPQDIKRRKHIVEDAMTGEYLKHYNETEPCPPLPQLPYDEQSTISIKMLKILVLAGSILFLIAIQYILEQVFCGGRKKDSAKDEESDVENGATSEAEVPAERQRLLEEGASSDSTENADDFQVTVQREGAIVDLSHQAGFDLSNSRVTMEVATPDLGDDHHTAAVTSTIDITEVVATENGRI